MKVFELQDDLFDFHNKSPEEICEEFEYRYNAELSTANSAGSNYGSWGVINPSDCNCISPLTNDPTQTGQSMDEEELDVNLDIHPVFLLGVSERLDVGLGQSQEFSRPKSHRASTNDYLRQIYEQNRLVDLEEIADKKARATIQMVMSVICESFDPQDPTRPDDIKGCTRKIKLLAFMRKDQYVKKAWSMVKILLYSPYKNSKTLKSTAHNNLKKDLFLNDDNVFQNLFGSNTCDGLKVESVKYILTSECIFNKIFDHCFFRKLRRELNNQTIHEIEINFLKKFDPYFQGEQDRPQKAASHFRKDRSVKTPFTFLENNTSLIILLDKFIKQLKKIDSISEANKLLKMKRLTSIREELIAFAQTNNWVLTGCKFKKSEIVSFLF
jgi:hypothetical protein